MDTLKVFENPAFGEIRVMTIEGEPWMVGKDVAEALGYVNPRKALIDHVDSEDKNTVTIRDGIPGNPNMTVINESGLYSLVLSSKLPDAKKFRRWVTSEVLPSIRKHGAYMTPETLEAALLNPDTLIRLATELKAEREQRQALEAKIAADAPKVRYADAVSVAEGGMLIREFAKILKQNGVPDMGEKRLYEDLRRRGLLIKAEGRDKNKPTQYAMERGLFAVREREFSTPLGTFARTTTLITGKGRQCLLDMYLKERDAAPVADGAI